MIEALFIALIAFACFLTWLWKVGTRSISEAYLLAAHLLMREKGRCTIVEIDGKEYTMIVVPTRRERKALTDWDKELQKLKDKGDQYDHE